MSARRGMGLLIVAIAFAAALHAAGSELPAPPFTDPGRLGAWWSRQGTDVAALSLVRVGGLAFCCYLGVISALGVVAALTRWHWTERLARFAATPVLRRTIAGGSLAAAVTSGYAAAASTPPVYNVTDLGGIEAGADPRPAHSAGTARQPTLFHAVADIGPARHPPSDPSIARPGTAHPPADQRDDQYDQPEDQHVVADLGPVTELSAIAMSPRVPRTGSGDDPETRRGPQPSSTERVSDEPAQRGEHGEHGGAAGADRGSGAEPAHPLHTRGSGDPGNSDTWVVEAGDNLWGIAAATVFQRGGGDDHLTVARYWIRLIDANTDVVGDDPDLIHPGQIIRLPA